MHDLSCRTARLWLQEPGSLPTLDARQLDRHLAGCGACRDYRRWQTEMDRLLRQSLQSVARGMSVRQQVQARLSEAAPPRTRSTHPLSPLLRAVRPALAVAALASAAAVAAFLLPQMTSRNRDVTPAGAAWHLVRPTIGFPLTLDPRHPSHLLVGAWGQVYQSWNAGRSWQRLGALPAGLIIRDLAVDVAQSTRFLVATKHSVLVSDDAGRHWRLVATNLLGAEDMFLTQDLRRPRTFYLGPSVLWTSQDGGRSWQKAGPGTIFAPDGIQSLAVAPNGSLYTGIWAGGVAVSHDGGRSWRRRARGLARDVMTVALGRGVLWAATDHGVFSSRDGGRHWSFRGPSRRFFATSVVDGGSYVLAGGNDALYRSSDGGRHWSVATDGLPLAPYVYNLLADPSHPKRVYASLNGDGIFRSDDGGQHWTAANQGLPIALQEGKPDFVLFLRGGTLWISNGKGSDPGNLTVDQTVTAAALSPDAAAAAYLTGGPGGWSVRLVDAGGSLARTVDAGIGHMPRHLLWSPDALHLAVVRGPGVTVADLSGGRVGWSVPPAERLIGWTPDGRALLFWDRTSGTVVARARTTGQITARLPGRYGARPLPGPEGREVALVSGGRLLVGPWGGTRPLAHVAAGCRPTAWSENGQRLLLTCPMHLEERLTSGRLVAHIPFAGKAEWAPGSDTDLLLFRRGALWRWSAGHLRKIVREARAPW